MLLWNKHSLHGTSWADRFWCTMNIMSGQGSVTASSTISKHESFQKKTRCCGAYGTYWQNYYFLLICSPAESILLPGRAAGLSRHKQLQFLKGKFHRLSGAIDFHLSTHRAKVCIDIIQILTDIVSPHLVRLHLYFWWQGFSCVLNL